MLLSVDSSHSRTALEPVMEAPDLRMRCTDLAGQERRLYADWLEERALS